MHSLISLLSDIEMPRLTHFGFPLRKFDLINDVAG